MTPARSIQRRGRTPGTLTNKATWAYDKEDKLRQNAPSPSTATCRQTFLSAGLEYNRLTCISRIFYPEYVLRLAGV